MSGKTLADKLHEQRSRRQLLDKARAYARLVMEDLPAETSSEVYKEVADAYLIVAREQLKAL